VIAKATSARQIQDARNQQTSLQTQISTWQATYAQLLTNLQQGATNSPSVVEHARVPTAPVSSSTAANVLLAAVIGLVLAGGAAFLIEYLDDTLKTSDDVRKIMDLPTLGGIAPIEGDGYANKLITAQQPRSANAEAYRILRTNIQFSAVDEPLRTLMITSASPEEGKSVTAANIAIVMAQAGQRVILVDADLRRPMLHCLFDLTNNVGLTTILLDSEASLSDMLQATMLDNLKIMTAGPVPPNPSELLGSKRMGYLIEALKKQADAIVFDSAPVTAITDASVLARRLDGTLLVVDAGHTRRAPAQHAKEALIAVGATLIGVVLNRLPNRGHIYNYYYASDSQTSSAKRATRVPLKLVFRRNGQSAHADMTLPHAAPLARDAGKTKTAP
jgi:capsular exopolysaccharide synthesis family protein